MKRSFTTLMFLILLSTLSFSQSDTLAMWTFPNNDLADTLPDFHNTFNAESYVFTEGASAIIMKNGLTTKAAQATEWQDGDGVKSWQILMNTSNYKTLELSVKLTAGGSNPGPRDFKTQYRIGTDGIWTDIFGGELTVLNDWTTGVLSNLILPSECENIEELFIRFVMTSNIGQDGTEVIASGTSKIEDILITGNLFSGIAIITNENCSVFPNPSHGIFTLESTQALGSIIIFSSNGQLVYSFDSHNNLEQISLDVPAGLYLIDAKDVDNNHTYTKLMIK